MDHYLRHNTDYLAPILSKEFALEDFKTQSGHNNSGINAISIDFFSSRFLHRIKTTHHKSDIAKACSLKSWSTVDGLPSLKILDLTAGLGTDAVMLAYLGADMTLLERHADVHSALADALMIARDRPDILPSKSAMHSSVTERIQTAICERVTLLARQDSYDFLSGSDDEAFDCIYFDPMFPARKKSAKVKLAMQIFHQIVGFDFEQEERLLNLAIEKTKARVVVKRSKQSGYIAGIKPSYSIKLKALRYDIYLKC
jgi:16S rRNA (guanine1516-N2)-methyltransferase